MTTRNPDPDQPAGSDVMEPGPQPGTPGARKADRSGDDRADSGNGISEFFTAELATVLNCGRGTAGHLARRSPARARPG